MIKLREDGDLDGAGRRQYLVGMQQIFLPGREIDSGDAENAVQIAVDPGNGCLQLLPQYLLFLVRHFFLRSLLREARHRGPNYEGEQSGKEKAFQHGDLRVSGIIRPNGGARRKALPIIFTVSQEVGWSCRKRYAGAGRACRETRISRLLKRHPVRTTIETGTHPPA